MTLTDRRPAEELFCETLANETLLPEQFADRLRIVPSTVPEKRLMLAVLEEAVATFQQFAAAKKRRGQRLFREAEEWILSERADWPFAFENICAELDFEPAYLRWGLLAWKNRKRSETTAAPVTRLPLRRSNGVRHSVSLPAAEWLRKSA